MEMQNGFQILEESSGQLAEEGLQETTKGNRRESEAQSVRCAELTPSREE